MYRINYAPQTVIAESKISTAIDEIVSKFGFYTETFSGLRSGAFQLGEMLFVSVTDWI